MSSSTFEVKSESDNEKGIDFGLDTCETNGIVTSDVEGDVPKDHTYTKESVLQEEEQKESDTSGNIEEKDVEEKEDILTPVKTKTAKQEKNNKTSKRPTRGRPKKEESQMEKDVVVPKRVKSKRVTGTKAKVIKNVEFAKKAPPVKQDKNVEPPKRGRKRKFEEKENVNDQNSSVPARAKRSVSERAKNPPEEKKTSTKPLRDKKPLKTGTLEVAPGDTIDYRNLPKGWMRKTVVRKSGKSAGQIDIYIYSPDGVKCRSRPDVAAYLQRTKSSLKLEDFDFSRKTASENLQNSSKTPQKKVVSPAPKSKIKAAKKKLPTASPKKPKKLLVKFDSKRGRKAVAAKKAQKKVVKSTKSPKQKKAVNTTSKSLKKKT